MDLITVTRTVECDADGWCLDLDTKLTIELDVDNSDFICLKTSKESTQFFGGPINLILHKEAAAALAKCLNDFIKESNEAKT